MSKGSMIRLVIVDDHEVVRIGLCAVLNLTPGMMVLGQGRRMKDATKLCCRLQPDLVLLDIRLPDGSGIDAAREILVRYPQIRVLFLTSFADEHTVLEAILAGAHGYLLKDITSQALIRTIRSVAAGQVHFDPRLPGETLGWLKNRYGEPGEHSKRPLLSPQEQRLLPLVAQGLTNKEIAQDLHLSEKTVKNYLANLYTKLNIRRRSQIAAFYAGSFKGSGRRLSADSN